MFAAKAMASREIVRGQNGFTLTEIAIVLGIIGTILGAIWAASARVYSSQRTEKAVQQTIAIAGAVKTLFPSGLASQAQWLTPIMINSSIVPPDMLSSTAPAGSFGINNSAFSGNGQIMVNPWNAQVAVGLDVGFANDTLNNFDITIAPLTAGQCAAYLSALAPAAATAGLIEIIAPGVSTYLAVSPTSIPAPSTFAPCAGGQITLQFSLS